MLPVQAKVRSILHAHTLKSVSMQSKLAVAWLSEVATNHWQMAHADMGTSL